MQATMAAASWARYRAWNEAIAERLFSDASAGRAVYLAAEDEDVAAMCRVLDEPDDEGSAPLVSAVVATLNLQAGTNDFRDQLVYASARPSSSLDTPSSLALLVVLSLAAAEMDATDGMATHNYYGRLNRLLGIDDPDAQRRLQSGYQHCAEELWAPLHNWLIAWDGARGVPTAYPVGQRYIGLPMSQALVRQRDRHALRRVFAIEGLPPGYRMGTADMERVVDGWASRAFSPLSGTFRALWASPSARERMTAIAALELETWDGREYEGVAGGAATRAASVRLVATFRGFPRSIVELTLAVPTPDARPEATLLAQTPDGEIPVRLVSVPGGASHLANPREFDADSLLADEICLRDPESNHEYRRAPRTAVVLREDPLQGAYVETDRIQLGELCTLIVAEPLALRARQILAVVARPGYRELAPATEGVPPGWVVIRDVVVLARFEGQIHADLAVLQPLAGATLSVSGGFQMPGHLRKWSSLDPPEIQAICETSGCLRVRIDRGSRVGEAVLDETFDSSIAFVSLKGRELADGEYLVTLHADGASRPIASSVLRLRSSDVPTPAVGREIGSLGHQPTSQGPVWAINASEVVVRDGATGAPIADPEMLCGLLAQPLFDLAAQALQVSAPARTGAVPTPAALYSRRDVQNGVAGMTAARSRPRPSSAPAVLPVVRVGRGLGDASCMKTLAHRFELPDDRPDAPKSAFIESACVKCGLEKRFPTKGRKKRVERKKTSAPLVIGNLPAVPSTDDAERALVAFDTLCHLGGGPSSSLERVAAQVDSSALYGDRLLRSLEVLGHIEVERAHDYQPVRWAMTPPTLVSLSSGEAWLLGWRSPSMVGELRAAVELWGGAMTEAVDSGVPRVTIAGIAPELLAEVVGDASLGVRSPELGALRPSRLASLLPNLSTVGRALMRSPLPALQAVSRWDTDSATWMTVAGVNEPGAYRLQSAVTRYGFRSRRDLVDGTIALTGVHLVKHLASAVAGDQLAGYHSESSSVVVPLGADLPAVYGRVLTACSGRLPKAIEGHRLLQYPNVPRDVADAVADRLKR